VVNWLRAAGARVRFKPFAMGVRIEHAQAWIDRTQYGALAGHPALGAAHYRLAQQVDGTGVYSFCMCPGGFIVPAATADGQQVVNGMSPSQRRGRFANSGFVMEVARRTIADAGFDAEDELCGLNYQAALEQRAYRAGGGGFRAPAQDLEAFVQGRKSSQLPPTSYHRGVTSVLLDDVLRELAAPIRRALLEIDRRMPGFISDRALAVGVESRTSAPYRMAGVYPAGEGGGYAGGIVSAALDGIRVADAIAQRAGVAASR
jgi:uncharacterized FAD-dependent dehydrogenase